jgi:type IV secretion system protein VirD4
MGEMGLLSLAWKIIKPILKVMYKVFMFTGLIVPVGLDIIRQFVPIPIEVVFASFIVVPYFLTQNIMRRVKKEPKYNLLKAMITHKNGKSEDSTQKTINMLASDTKHGVFFGVHRQKYIAKPEQADGHILVVGGVGSGKSSCIAIPTLQCWNERIFALDIKGELYEKTKHVRGNIKVFNPLDENSFGYDPFLFLKSSSNPAQEARTISQAIIPLPPNCKDPFWIESAQNILTGAILHYYVEKSFLDTIRAIQNTSPPELINQISQSGSEEARYCVNSFVGMESKTLSSIMAELSKGLVALVTDRNLASCFSREKVISPMDLEYGSDIYINIPEHLLRQWKNLLTLIVNQFLTFFEQRLESNSTPILFLLDEFPRLGKISNMLDALATLRSKKITICLIVQSLAQLDTIYGQNERKVISDTCAYKAILSATDADTQEYFSKLVGTHDKRKDTSSANLEQYSGLGKGTGTSTTTEEKRIIKPEEFGRLHDIVLLTPYGFCRVEKRAYWEGD